MKLHIARKFDPGWHPTIEAEVVKPAPARSVDEAAGVIVLFVLMLVFVLWKLLP